MNDLTSTYVKVSWQNPTVTDNSGESPVIFSNWQPGALFDVPGSYEVLYEARDESGNKATCSFRITLKREYGVDLFEAPHNFWPQMMLFQNC